MNSNQNYYEIFGISETATLREIKDAYRKKAMEFHPDVNPNKESCHEMMCLINQIYFILRNPLSRAQYDQTLEKNKVDETGSISSEDSEERTSEGRTKTYTYHPTHNNEPSSAYEEADDYDINDYNDEEQKEFIDFLDLMDYIFLVKYEYLIKKLDDAINLSETFKNINKVESIRLQKTKKHSKRL